MAFRGMEKLENILKEFQPVKRDSLIPILQAVQDEFGYLSSEAVEEIGAHLKLPTSKIYGLATFYNQFTFSTRGKYHIRVCNGSACHIDHSYSLLKEIRKQLAIGDGESTRDGMFSLEIVACIGACGQSPVIAINNEFFPKVNTQRIREILENIRANHR